MKIFAGRGELSVVVRMVCKIFLIFFFSLSISSAASNLTEDLNSVTEILSSVNSTNNSVEDLSFLLSTHGYTTDGRGNLTLSDGSMWKIQENKIILIRTE
jgi:hypothetical protein